MTGRPGKKKTWSVKKYRIEQESLRKERSLEKKRQTYQTCLREGERILSQAGITEAGQDAWLLMEEVFGISRARYYMEKDHICDDGLLSRYQELIRQREKRIPLQQIVGHAPFMLWEFAVSDQVLTPRPDTEILVETVFSRMEQLWEVCHRPLQILDMCTGSGCIAISLFCLAEEKNIPCDITAVDLSAEALQVASQNNDRLCNRQVRLLQSNLFESLSETLEFDIIVSNPPYIRSKEIADLMPEVREHEPHMALDGREDGLYFYRRLAREGRAFLRSGGGMYLEIGYDQGPSVSDILKEQGYHSCRVLKDLAGLDRVVLAKKEQKQPENRKTSGEGESYV